jgi:hypothetical protein
MGEQRTWIELLKYPIIILTVLLAAIAARYTLGIEFGRVTEISKEGIKFEQAAGVEIVDLASKVSSLTITVDELRKNSPANQTLSPQAETDIFEAAQTVSDPTAKLASGLTNAAFEKSRGFIWIGDYKDGWSKTTIASPGSAQPVSIPPDKLLPGTEYQMRCNVVVRAALPPNDAKYYRSPESRGIGVIPTGAKIRLVKQPQGIDRKYAVQYWAEVEAL